MLTARTYHRHVLSSGNTSVDQTLRVLLGTNMLVGGVLACLLDNTIPGEIGYGVMDFEDF